MSLASDVRDWMRPGNHGTLTSRHAWERAAERLGVRLPPDTVSAIIANSDQVAASTKRGRSVAYVAHRFGYQVGTAWGSSSNGDLVVAIIREGKVVTYMLRRSSQPLEPAALSVDEVMT